MLASRCVRTRRCRKCRQVSSWVVTGSLPSLLSSPGARLLSSRMDWQQLSPARRRSNQAGVLKALRVGVVRSFACEDRDEDRSSCRPSLGRDLPLQRLPTELQRLQHGSGTVLTVPPSLLDRGRVRGKWGRSPAATPSPPSRAWQERFRLERSKPMSPGRHAGMVPPSKRSMSSGART